MSGDATKYSVEYLKMHIRTPQLTQSCRGVKVKKEITLALVAALCNNVCLFPNQRPRDHTSEGRIKSHYAKKDIAASCSLPSCFLEAK